MHSGNLPTQMFREPPFAKRILNHVRELSIYQIWCGSLNAKIDLAFGHSQQSPIHGQSDSLDGIRQSTSASSVCASTAFHDASEKPPKRPWRRFLQLGYVVCSLMMKIALETKNGQTAHSAIRPPKFSSHTATNITKASPAPGSKFVEHWLAAAGY